MAAKGAHLDVRWTADGRDALPVLADLLAVAVVELVVVAVAVGVVTDAQATVADVLAASSEAPYGAALVLATPLLVFTAAWTLRYVRVAPTVGLSPDARTAFEWLIVGALLAGIALVVLVVAVELVTALAWVPTGLRSPAQAGATVLVTLAYLTLFLSRCVYPVPSVTVTADPDARATLVRGATALAVATLLIAPAFGAAPSLGAAVAPLVGPTTGLACLLAAAPAAVLGCWVVSRVAVDASLGW